MRKCRSNAPLKNFKFDFDPISSDYERSNDGLYQCIADTVATVRKLDDQGDLGTVLARLMEGNNLKFAAKTKNEWMNVRKLVFGHFAASKWTVNPSAVQYANVMRHMEEHSIHEDDIVAEFIEVGGIHAFTEKDHKNNPDTRGKTTRASN